ncbi:hypothetical protein PAXINDRAFT_14020 [Paxillus involutus ATCC 200175]|uniref:DUF6532 domain-containing protein n=1 Tax=Paxillus involutus ATCC 200175 TaxID=664439 RepID=A0A0C9SV38_PAXIN|nr:hypothetical protein PAXINDRAFT_14020 [Paxillus involutus ATCC 200175]
MGKEKLTLSEKTKAIRAKQTADSEMETLRSDPAPRPPRQAKVDAMQKKVWMTLEPKSRKRAASSVAGTDKVKQVKLNVKVLRKPAAQDAEDVKVLRKPAARDAEAAPTHITRKANAIEHDSDGTANLSAEDGENIQLEGLSQDEDMGDDNLERIQHNVHKMKVALDAERPQFVNTTHHRDSSGTQVSSRKKANPCHSTSDSESTSDRLFAAKPSRVIATTSSHYARPSSSPTGMDDSDNDNDCIDTPPSSTLSRIKNHTTGSVQAHRKRVLTKREQRIKLEQVSVADEGLGAESDRSSKDTGPQVKHSRRQRPNHTWDPTTHLVFSENGKVNLNDQQPHIGALLRRVIKMTHIHLVFENSYLVDPVSRKELTANFLLAATENHTECEAVRCRLKLDEKYIQNLASIPEGRVAGYRSAVKSSASCHVASVYGLMKGSKVKAEQLLQGNNFIFPFDAQGKPITSKPFQSAAIVYTLEDAFFTDDRAAGVKYHDQLVSTRDDRPDELEIPAAMLSLATTAVQSEIMSYLESDIGKSHNFNSNTFANVYNRFALKLSELFDQNNGKKYHVLMKKLYHDVYGAKRNAAADNTPGDALMEIDLAGMEED